MSRARDLADSADKDIAGTLTLDGLTVDKEGTDHLKITDTSSSNTLTIGVGNTVGAISVDPTNSVASSDFDIEIDGNRAIRVAEGGDIIFYDSDENTSFVYDESAGSTFNENGDDKDFRVESDSNTHALFVDAGDDKVIVGKSSGSQGGFGVFTGSLGGNVVAEFSDQVNATLRIDQVADKTNAIGGNSDHALVFGYHDTSTWAWTTWGRFNATSGDFVTLKGAIFNDDSGDHDFRIESDSVSHMFFVDAGQNRIGIGQSSGLHGNRLNIEKSDSQTDGPEIVMKNLYQSSGGDDELGSITFGGWRDVSDTGSYVAAIAGYDVTNPGTSGQLRFFTKGNGNTDPSGVRVDGHEMMRITDTEVILNEHGTDNDFRVESDSTTDLLVCEGSGVGLVHIGKSAGGFGNPGCTLYPQGELNLTTDDNRTPLYLRRNHSDGTILSFHRSASQVGSIGVTGSSTSYNTSSDHRLKENVVDLTGATERVKQLQPKRFNFISDEDDTVVDGFLAHEAQTVVPEAVTGTHNEVDADGNPVYQGIDQSKLVPLLVATIKELEARITALENA